MTKDVTTLQRKLTQALKCPEVFMKLARHIRWCPGLMPRTTVMNFLLKLGKSSFSILTDPVTMSEYFDLYQKLLMLCLILKCTSKIKDWH